MIAPGYRIENKLKKTIEDLERDYNIEISKIQQILLSIHGPITTVLDVLYGDVNLFILNQQFKNADKDMADLIDVNKHDEVFHREVIVHKHGKPLVYASSLIPKSRCPSEIFDEIHRKQLTTGKIAYKFNFETFRKITKISIEKSTPLFEELFKTDEDLLTREYVMIHDGKIFIHTKEAYPLSYFRE